MEKRLRKLLSALSRRTLVISRIELNSHRNRPLAYCMSVIEHQDTLYVPELYAIL